MPNENLIKKIDLKKIYELQKRDFDALMDVFEQFIYSQNIDVWKTIITGFLDAIKNCDDIPYKENSVALPYAIHHFLDRYHRFQMLIIIMLSKGLLCFDKGRKYNVLDIGTGPSQTLFALSDYFSELNEIIKRDPEDENYIGMVPEYVEQSDDFKAFLHHFVEFAICKGKRYTVPFHFSKADNAYDFKFDEDRICLRRYRGKLLQLPYTKKSRYDVVVMNNFITNKEILNHFTPQLKKICRYMRNHGLLIVIGAPPGIQKYREIYTELDKIVGKRFRHNNYRGYWTKIVDEDIRYTYNDYYGKRLRDYNQKLMEYLKTTDDAGKKALWDYLEDEVKRKIINIVMQTPEKTAKEKWEGLSWRVVIYQKHSRYEGER